MYWTVAAVAQGKLQSSTVYQTSLDPCFCSFNEMISTSLSTASSVTIAGSASSFFTTFLCDSFRDVFLPYV